MPTAPPKFTTPRDLSRPTRGGAQSDFARIWLRAPFMPHQSHIADVSGELIPNPEYGHMENQPRWIPAYPLVVVTEPRRAGKSHQALSGTGERCLSEPGYRAWYTAQTGSDARDQFIKFGELVAETPLSGLTRTLIGNGREVMHFRNGSQLRPHPPTEKALHGKDSDRNDVDEAWAFSEAEGRLLMQAISPTHATRPGAQTFIWSAGGTAASTWLAKLVAEGRAGTNPRMAYFEYGIPDDADAEDLDVVEAHHPAAGFTITRSSLEAIRAEFGDDPSGWARAFGNRWTEVIGGAISERTWAGVQHPDPFPDGCSFGWGTARSEDGSQVAIACAAEVDGFILVEIVDVLPTAYLAADHVAGWAGHEPVAAIPAGASASLVDDIERTTHANLITLTGREEAAACAQLLDALPHRRIRFRPHPALTEAVKVAGKRRVAEGGYAWSRVATGAPIASIEAATNAVWALTHGTPTGTVLTIPFGA